MSDDEKPGPLVPAFLSLEFVVAMVVGMRVTMSVYPFGLPRRRNLDHCYFRIKMRELAKTQRNIVYTYLSGTRNR